MEEPADFTAFFAEQHREVFKALFFVTGNRADAAELMQEAFLKLWERWDRIDRLADPRVLVEGDQIEFPRWSPDGSRIAYTDSDGIYVVEVSTGRSTLVPQDGTVDWFGNDTLVVACPGCWPLVAP